MKEATTPLPIRRHDVHRDFDTTDIPVTNEETFFYCSIIRDVGL
jgi:hypothetical protein